MKTVLCFGDSITWGSNPAAGGQRHARADQRIQVISTENRGVAAARNLGISRAANEYVAFLDADDLWHPTKIEKQLAALHGKPETWAAAYAYFRSIDAEDFVTGGTFQAGASGYIFGRHLCIRYIGNGSSLLVRRKAVLEVGGTYYLPYQPHATVEQFHRAYPRAGEFFALRVHDAAPEARIAAEELAH